MNDQLQKAAYQLRHLGWQGLIGIVLLFAALLIFGMATVNIGEAKTLRATVDQLQMHTLETVKRDTAEDVVKDFYSALPAQERFNDVIAEILLTAEDYGFVLDRSDYTGELVPQTMMVQYQIKLPLMAPYVEIRRFITDVMNMQPSIALDNVSFSRRHINDDVVDAHVEFILYTKQ